MICISGEFNDKSEPVSNILFSIFSNLHSHEVRISSNEEVMVPINNYKLNLN
jgi:hypothetical protein